MEDSLSTQKLLVLRKLTRAVADLLLKELTEHLATLTPLLKPKAVLGGHIHGASKETARGADKALRELQELYAGVCGAPPFNLARDLRPPLDVDGSLLELVPFEYTHAARTKKEEKTVTITSPLKWVLYYSGYSLSHLREVVNDADGSGPQLQQFVLNHLVLHVAVLRQKGVPEMLAALRFPVSLHRYAEFGGLPVTVVSSSVPTVRPSDATLIESTEVSGSDEFEEVVSVEEILKMTDPLRERLIALVRSQSPELL